MGTIITVTCHSQVRQNDYVRKFLDVSLEARLLRVTKKDSNQGDSSDLFEVVGRDFTSLVNEGVFAVYKRTALNDFGIRELFVNEILVTTGAIGIVGVNIPLCKELRRFIALHAGESSHCPLYLLPRSSLGSESAVRGEVEAKASEVPFTFIEY